MSAGSLSAPRVRFAPSPTGYFHVGSARAALYNWLFARHHGGTFILRIEDTDTERNREEWLEGICAAMEWLGLGWDEGPFRQSERRALFDAALARLVDTGSAYYCTCTRDDVESRKAAGATPGYDGYCRDRALTSGALRFRVSPGDPVVVHDMIRGDVTFERGSIEDFVVAKSSGDPLFVLANVVDDIEMAITHVIRGEDLLPSTPKGLLVWEALGGGALPKFAHLPLLVNEKRQKLSKRRDPVALEEYRARGFLPEVMVGYLALLGWSPKDEREMLTRSELIEEFRIEEVNHSPAFFDVAKLTHFNGEAIRTMDVTDFSHACGPWIGTSVMEKASADFPVAPPPWDPGDFDAAVFTAMAPLVQERVTHLDQVPGMVGFLFARDVEVDEDSWQRAVATNDKAPSILRDAVIAYREIDGWEAARLLEATAAIGEAAGLKLGKAQAPIRVAVTGRTVGPPLFESIELLGRERTVARLEAALARIGR